MDNIHGRPVGPDGEELFDEMYPVASSMECTGRTGGGGFVQRYLRHPARQKCKGRQPSSAECYRGGHAHPEAEAQNQKGAIISVTRRKDGIAGGVSVDTPPAIFPLRRIGGGAMRKCFRGEKRKTSLQPGGTML